MKNDKYNVINNPLGGYDFSIPGCHAAEAGAYVTGGIILALICAFFMLSENGDLGVLIKNIWIPAMCSLPLYVLGLSMTIRVRRVKAIMAKGEKTEGEVISYRRIHITHGRRSHLVHEPNHTILNVSFYDNGHQECAVSAGRRLPEDVLASPQCTVYILGNDVFVTGFSLRKQGEPHIAFEQEDKPAS